MTLRLEYAKRWSVGWSDNKWRSIRVVMEYLPTLSKNRSHTRDGLLKRDVKAWRDCLAWVINFEVKGARLDIEPPITVKISGTFAGRGRKPDTQNFVDSISDSIEAGLGINDQKYRIQTEPMVSGEESEIVIEIIGGSDV